MCSPDHLNEFGRFEGFDTVEQVDRVHLIRSPLMPWRTWFDAGGISLPEPRIGSQFNDMARVRDAAVAGFRRCTRVRAAWHGVAGKRATGAAVAPLGRSGVPTLHSLEAGYRGAMGIRSLRRLVEARLGRSALHGQHARRT